jgi:hypothetical protein
MGAALRLRRLYSVYPRPCGICLQANDRTLFKERHGLSRRQVRQMHRGPYHKECLGGIRCVVESRQ